jgi:DNA mismatch endonuclease (patch repair protein)
MSNGPPSPGWAAPHELAGSLGPPGRPWRPVSSTVAGTVAGDSWASSPAARRTMRSNRGRDTQPELALRSTLHRMGARFRVDAPLPGLRRRADLLFSRARVAVFVDGCFWHGCAVHFRRPGTNALYWLSKIERNRWRDLDTTRRLADAGWAVVRVWEHEDPSSAALRVFDAIGTARETRPPSGSS